MNQQQQQETIELGNKRNQTRLLEQMSEISQPQKLQLLISILNLPKQERKAEILQIMRIIMQNVDFFTQFHSKNDPEAYDYCLRHFQIDSFQKNTVIFEKGEFAYNMYVVLKGQVSLYSNDHLVDQVKTRKHSFSVDYGRDSSNNSKVKYSDFKINSLIRLTEYKEWKTFGEQSIIEERPRTNIALCDQETILAILSRDDYLNAVSIMEKKKQQHQMNSFKLNPSFQGLNKKLINLMLFTFSSFEYKFRDIIYKQGQVDSDNMYIIKQGEFLMYQLDYTKNSEAQQKRVRKQVAIMTPGELFGNYEAFEKIPRQSFVQCSSHIGSLIVVPLQALSSKLLTNNEHHYLQQLRILCNRKQNWHQLFMLSVEQTQDKFKQYLQVSDKKQQDESPKKIINQKDFQQKTEYNIQVNPIVELKNTLNFLTSIEEAQQSLQQNENLEIPSQQNSSVPLSPSPEKLQPLPKIKMVTSRASDRDKLSTPDRFNKIIRNKMSIVKRIHNLSPQQEDSINLNTLQQKTIYVPLPKQLQLEQKTNRQWPIKASLYLNDLDDSIRQHLNEQQIKSSRAISLNYEQLSNKKVQDEFFSQRNSKMSVLNSILQHTVTKKGRNNKKRLLTLGFRSYIEQQYQQKTQNSLQYS